MKELLTAKANIDRILKLEKIWEEPNVQKEKEAESQQARNCVEKLRFAAAVFETEADGEGGGSD